MKLGMGDLIGSAVASLWRGGRPIALCLLLWAGAEFANGIARQTYDPGGWLLFAAPVSWVLDVQSLSSGVFFALKELIDSVLRDLVGCVFIAAMLRIILTGSAGASGAEPGGLARASGRVLLFSLAVTAAMSVPSWPVLAFADVNSPANETELIEIGLMLLFVVLLVFLAARLCLVYPGVAVGRGWSLRQNWRRTEGNGIRLSVVLAMLLVGVAIVDSVLDVFIFERSYELDDLPGPGWLIAAKEVGELVSTTAFLMAISAVAFARLTEFPAVGVPGASKTPEQLAEAFE